MAGLGLRGEVLAQAVEAIGSSDEHLLKFMMVRVGLCCACFCSSKAFSEQSIIVMNVVLREGNEQQGKGQKCLLWCLGRLYTRCSGERSVVVFPSFFSSFFIVIIIISSRFSFPMDITILVYTGI